MTDTGPFLLPPGLLSVPGVLPELLESLFAAAAEFYLIQPWAIINDEKVIEVQAPDPRLVVVMGAAGQAFGISVYDSPADLQHMVAAAHPLEAAEAICWLALTYETSEYMHRDDLQAIQKYGWRVAGEAAYPAIARIGSPGPDLQPPALNDLLWLEGCLRALCQFFTSYPALAEQGEPRALDITIPVQTSTGLLQTRLRLPGMQV